MNSIITDAELLKILFRQVFELFSRIISHR
jgi:hypothetical protein